MASLADTFAGKVGPTLPSTTDELAQALRMRPPGPLDPATLKAYFDENGAQIEDAQRNAERLLQAPEPGGSIAEALGMSRQGVDRLRQTNLSKLGGIPWAIAHDIGDLASLTHDAWEGKPEGDPRLPGNMDRITRGTLALTGAGIASAPFKGAGLCVVVSRAAAEEAGPSKLAEVFTKPKLNRETGIDFSEPPAARPGAVDDPELAAYMNRPRTWQTNYPPPPSLPSVYEARAAQMALKPSQRIQAVAGRERVIGNDYTNVLDPPPGGHPDMANLYPRNPNPDAALPQGGRGQPLIDFREQIAERLAQKIRDAGQLGAPTQYFYHSDGPIYRAARAAGLGDEDARRWVSDFGHITAATSPRTNVDQNVLNATSVMAKHAANVPFREILGPGSGGISERGYPMMTGGGGIHGQLIDDILSGRGIDPNVNTKPSQFAAANSGNRSGVVVDTHIIRGVMQTLNELQPGSIPEKWIMPAFREAYRHDPTTLTPNMISDTLAKQRIGPKGATYSAQTEYPLFADIYHRVAEHLGVSPSEAQSMGWFGLGQHTNLGSAPETLADVLDKHISITSQGLNLPPQEVARLLFQRKLPLMSILGTAAGGAAALDALNQTNQNPGGT